MLALSSWELERNNYNLDDDVESADLDQHGNDSACIETRPAVPLKLTLRHANPVDIHEMFDDLEADLSDSDLSLEPPPSSSSHQSKLCNPNAAQQKAVQPTPPASTGAVPPRSSDEDERPSKRAKVNNRVDASDQMHGMFRFFKPVTKEQWREATDEEARRSKGKWKDIQKQAVFTKLAKQEHARDQARNRKRAQRAREKAAKANIQTLLVS